MLEHREGAFEDAPPGCPLCGGRIHRALMPLSPPPFRAHACQTCGLYHAQPRSFGGSVERSAHDLEHYDYHGAAKLHRAQIGILTPVFAAEFRWACAPPPAAGAVLDVGCGHGFILAAASRLGYSPVGIEPVAELKPFIEAEIPGARVITADFESVDLGDARFALIRMRHTLEHMHDPALSLRKARRHLAPGGVLLIDLPNPDALVYRLRRLAGRPEYSLTPPYDHLFAFPLAALRYGLAAAGFRRMRARTFAVTDRRFNPNKQVRSLKEAAVHAVDLTGALFGAGGVLQVAARF